MALPSALLLSAFCATAALHAATLNGAGSTAAAPVYTSWAKAYGKTNDFQLNYDPIGSSAGMKKIQANQATFAASDIPLKQAELDANGWVMAPTFVTAVVPVVNLPKVPSGKLRLTAEVLAGIFSGEIVRWNAPQIQSLNDGLALPDLPIKLIVRADGSGTTFYFSQYLSATSSKWQAKYGAKTTIDWPQSATGASGGGALGRVVKETAGAISYADLSNANDLGLTTALLRNAAGEFVTANPASVREALLGSSWFSSNDFQGSITNSAKRTAWPILMGSFIYLPKVSDKAANAQQALNFFVWALMRGDSVIEGSNFIRLPDKMQASVFKALAQVKDKQGRAMGMEALVSIGAK